MVNGTMSNYKPEVLFIQESKLKNFDSRILRSIGGSWLSRVVGANVEGASSGLLILWNEESFVVEDCITNKMCIIVSGILSSCKKRIVFYNVYAPSVENERKELLEFILGAMQTLTAP